MARYIDVDKLSKMIEARAEQLIEGKEALLYVAKWLNLLPEADVAPRSEVAREIFEEIEELFRQHKEGGYYLNGAWYPERLDLYTEDAFEELKKKYTEARND